MSSRTIKCFGLGLVATVAVGVLAAPATRAAFGVEAGSFVAKTHHTIPLQCGFSPGIPMLNCRINVTAIKAAAPVTEAGAHPDATTSIVFNNNGQKTNNDVKDIGIDVPAGFLGDPQAVPACSREALASTPGVGVQATGGCDPASQVGVVTLWINTLSAIPYKTFPVYRVTTARGRPASFAFHYFNQAILINSLVRSYEDYGLTLSSSNISAAYDLIGVTVTLWGVPSDPIHDSDRWNNASNDWGMSLPNVDPVDATAFLTNPTYCDSGPLNTALRVDSWQQAGTWLPETAGDPSYNAESPEPTGCRNLSFGGRKAPVGLMFQPQVHAADSPSGYDVKLTLPYNDDPDGLANPELRDVRVSLPAGVVTSPGAADGLGGCSPGQVGYRGNNFARPFPIRFTAVPAGCPDSSKIGTVVVHTPLLDHPIDGAVYLAQPYANPFNSLLAIYIALDDPQTGIVVKLAGHVVPDSHTGQLTATFANNPQLPFTEMDLSFFGGSRAPLTTPLGCGQARTNSVLTPWSSPYTPPVPVADSFSISSNCDVASGFSPSLNAGVENAAAGGHSPFTLTVSRDQGENVAGMDVTLPKGLLAALKGVKICPDSAAATGACPAASKIGHVTVAAGAGSHPLYVPQAGKAPTAVYLAGPYKGGPYSLVIKVPAQAGPFDLGTVAVRAALYVDPETAQVTVKSDPMPQILKGIPLEYRKINVVVDRKDFMRSPTNCTPSRVRADVEGAPLQGQVKVTPDGLGIATATDAIARLVNRFQVGGCGSLPFKPRMAMRLQGKHQRRDGGHPGLVATVREPKGQANIRNVRVALPLSIALDPKNSQHVCDYDKAKAVHGTKAPCPRSTIIGRAVAKTPLLPHKLRGRVYLVQGIRFNKEGQRIKTLPTLLVPLRGKDHVAIDLRAKTNVSHKKLVTTFRNVPDAQISSFKLHVFGASKKHPKGGLLVVTHNQNICHGRQVTDTTYRGQSGARYTDRVHMKAPCKGVKKARHAYKIKRLRRAAHQAARHGHKAKARKAIRRIHKLRHANNH